MQKQNRFEKIFETFLWNSRFIVLLAVFFGLISALALFILGSLEIVHSIVGQFSHSAVEEVHKPILISIIEAVDYYLIGIVLLLFSFGIYELFISKIDIARGKSDVQILEITSLDALKSKILKVIFMVLVVTFFERIISMPFNSSLDMLFFAISILAIAVGIHLIHSEKD